MLPLQIALWIFCGVTRSGDHASLARILSCTFMALVSLIAAAGFLVYGGRLFLMLRRSATVQLFLSYTDLEFNWCSRKHCHLPPSWCTLISRHSQLVLIAFYSDVKLWISTTSDGWPLKSILCWQTCLQRDLYQGVWEPSVVTLPIFRSSSLY